MVAGRSLGSSDQQYTAENQPGRGRQLCVEAILEDGAGARESRRLYASVESRRHVHQQDDQKAEHAEDGDDAPEPPAPGAYRRDGKRGSEQGHWDEEIEVGLAGCLGSDSRRGCCRQAGIAGLPHLNSAVVDELRGDQEARGGDDHNADRPVGREYRAGADCPSPRACGRLAYSSLEEPQAAEEQDQDRTQAFVEPPSASPHQDPGSPHCAACS